jgi:hypothetical protein
MLPTEAERSDVKLADSFALNPGSKAVMHWNCYQESRESPCPTGSVDWRSFNLHRVPSA